MSDVGERTITGLEEFLQKLHNGESIKATRVARYETPDGPMHTRTPVVLEPREQEKK